MLDTVTITRAHYDSLMEHIDLLLDKLNTLEVTNEVLMDRLDRKERLLKWYDAETHERVLHSNG